MPHIDNRKDQSQRNIDEKFTVSDQIGQFRLVASRETVYFDPPGQTGYVFFLLDTLIPRAATGLRCVQDKR